MRAVHIKDKDGNRGEVSVIKRQHEAWQGRYDYVIGVSADGLWLSPAKARTFARALLRAAGQVERKNAKKR